MGRKLGEYEETFAETGSDFIAEIVDSSAAFCVGGCALFLEVFCVAVEDLEVGRSWSLDGIGSPLWDAPAESGPRKKWS